MALWGTEKDDQKNNNLIENQAKVSGAQLLVKFLESKGVNQLYGIPGAGILPFYDAVRDSGKIQSFNVRHEQTAVFMADGYSRVTGKVGVCAATSGPGATNFLTGLYSAYVDSIPLIAITGQVPTSLLGKDSFQEAPMLEMAKPVTKGAYLLKKAEDLPGIIKEAYRTATTGRKGPVLIDFPLDMQKALVEIDLPQWLAEEDEEILPHVTSQELSEVLTLLKEAKRAVLLVGGGVVLANATKELSEIAALLQLPVVSTLMGKDAFPNDHVLYAGMVGTICQTPLGNKTILEADLILNLGGRFSDRTTGEIHAFKQNRKIIHVNIDKQELNRHVPTELIIQADIRDFLSKLKNRILQTGFQITPHSQTRINLLTEDKRNLARQTQFDQSPMKPQQAIAELRKCLKRDAIVVHDCGISQILSAQFFDAYKPRTYLVTGRAGTMGWGLGAAMAAKLAHPNTQCVNLVGDGSLGMSLADLATAAKHNIPVVIFLLNNSLFGLIRQQQNLFFGERWISTELDFYNEQMGHERGVDFVSTAQGLGVAAELIEKPEQIKEALERAFAANRPYLLEVLVDPLAMCSVSLDGTLSGVVEQE